MSNSRKSFSFMTVAYNHENYIVEHLESIKYLVETYASGYDCDLVINDDCSNDKTVFIIEEWLKRNKYLFCSVVKLFNKENIGTCASIINMLGNVKTPLFKLTAGDDVYSYENIFEYVDLNDDVSILSGYPLVLIDGVLSINKADIFSIATSDVIYNQRPLLDRFKFLSNSNAPNIIYNPRLLNYKFVLDFLKKFDVVEDWPIQIAIAEKFPKTKFKQVDKVFVYYRRTQGSTYLVAGSRFYEDKCNAYRYLIKIEKNPFNKIVLFNRLYCFKLNNRFSNKFLNIAFYKFSFSFFLNARKIHALKSSIDLNISTHNSHYELIKSRAIRFK